MADRSLPRVIAFDVDGVLVKGMECGGYNWHAELTRDFGISLEDVEQFFLNDWDACILGLADLRDVLPPYLERWGYKGSADDFMAYWFSHDSDLDHGLIADLDRLDTHCQLVIATNQDRHRAHYLWHELALSSRFVRMFASSELGVRKPDHSFWRAITDEVAASGPAEILLIDDSEANVASARDFGWQTIHYRNKSDLDDLLGQTST